MALVLIADDEPVQRMLMAEVLAAHPAITIIEVEDGEQALERVRAERPDIVILDVSMPKLDGLQVCRLIKADPALRAIPVILVTARPDEATGREAGCDDYVVKPYDTAKLEALVHTLLGLTHE